jgi:hypothetical protein
VLERPGLLELDDDHDGGADDDVDERVSEHDDDLDDLGHVGSADFDQH